MFLATTGISLLMPFGEYYFYKLYTTVSDYMTSFQKFCFFYGLVMYTAMIFLNFYWYYIILKRIKQLFTKKEEVQNDGTTDLHNM